MNNTNYIFFALLRSAIKNQPLTSQEKELFNIGLLPEIYKLSCNHDLVHLVSMAIEKNQLLDKENEFLNKFRVRQLKAIFRYEKLNYELNHLCNAFEKENIPYMLLKGSVIRNLYPEPWMRTSCDIDVLVHREDFAKTKKLLVERYGYTPYSETTHDEGFLAPNGSHIELHYTLIEEDEANYSSKILKKIWDNAVLEQGSHCKYQMTDEVFFFYHIAHMAKHIKNGGCGVRPFLDLWFLEKEKSLISHQSVIQMLESAKMLQFAKTAIKLSANWFEGAAGDDATTILQKFVLTGGVYGIFENRFVLQQHDKSRKLTYLLSRIFVSKMHLEKIYPSCKIRNWLIPFYQVRRWVGLCSKCRRKRIVNELKTYSNIPEQQFFDAKKMLNDLGLD